MKSKIITDRKIPTVPTVESIERLEKKLSSDDGKRDAEFLGSLFTANMEVYQMALTNFRSKVKVMELKNEQVHYIMSLSESDIDSMTDEFIDEKFPGIEWEPNELSRDLTWDKSLNYENARIMMKELKKDYNNIWDLKNAIDKIENNIPVIYENMIQKSIIKYESIINDPDRSEEEKYNANEKLHQLQHRFEFEQIRSFAIKNKNHIQNYYEEMIDRGIDKTYRYTKCLKYIKDFEYIKNIIESFEDIYLTKAEDRTLPGILLAVIISYISINGNDRYAKQFILTIMRFETKSIDEKQKNEALTGFSSIIQIFLT